MYVLVTYGYIDKLEQTHSCRTVMCQCDHAIYVASCCCVLTTNSSVLRCSGRRHTCGKCSVIQRLEETARHYVTSPRYFPTDNQITFPPGLHPLLHHPDTLLPFHLTNYTKLLQPAVILPGLSPNHLKPLTPLLPNPIILDILN